MLQNQTPTTLLEDVHQDTRTWNRTQAGSRDLMILYIYIYKIISLAIQRKFLRPCTAGSHWDVRINSWFCNIWGQFAQHSNFFSGSQWKFSRKMPNRETNLPIYTYSNHTLVIFKPIPRANLCPRKSGSFYQNRIIELS